ncbi:MAG: D-alanyl-D-alanine carboxypeptidase/D-alanyl-D-alanine-endopeptidase [Gemmatimonadota bacterium]|nr:D-alanyl-D-alanine carboxypeptidase/D-alanyl-D-alanine-endopeptidase [Gemmatimonadota bacterium]
MTTRLPWIVAAIAVLASCAPARGTTSAAITPPLRAPREVLRSSIDSLLADPQFRSAQLGILIVNPRTADTLYSRNAGKLFMPASNQKILTGAVALALLGPEYRYRTSILARGAVREWILDGDLAVAGNGDPTISDRARGSAVAALDSIAAALAAKGLKRVTGTVRPLGDAFPDSIYGYGWEWDDLSTSSGAPVDELLFNEGMIEIPQRIVGIDTIRSTATRAPVLSYLEALSSALARKGIIVAGGASADTVSGFPVSDTLHSFLSPPLREILRHFEKPSQNQIGEILIRTLGRERAGVGVADSGAAVISRQLLSWGAERDGFFVYDGSGLSRHNLVSPETIVRTLVGISRDTAFAVFLDALPVAGVDGTLRTRMVGTSAASNMRAKTGTIEFVRSLSGFITTADGERLVFSMLSNHFIVPVREITRVQDAIGATLANYKSDRSSSSSGTR